MKWISHLKNSIARTFFRYSNYALLALRYKIELKGLENLKHSPGEPGFLFLCNHPSHLDPTLVGTSLVKRGWLLNFWSLDFVYKNPYTRICVRNQDTVRMIKVPNIHEHRGFKNAQKIRHVIQRTLEELKEGEHILFFPSGAQKFTAREEVNGKSAVEKILKQYPTVKIMLVRITGMWGSRFSKAVHKHERSDLRAGNWLRFVSNIIKMISFNFVFFIPKRKITIEFVPAGPSFPRKGTRKEINMYLEEFFNRGYGLGGEPLQRIPDYFWKAKYTTPEFHIKSYKYDLKAVPESIKQDVVEVVTAVSHLKQEQITPELLLDRDLSLDSLEITDLLIRLEKKYPSLAKLAPKHVSSVGHLMALAAKTPIEYTALRGEFPIIRQEIPPVAKAWHACAGVITSLFGFLDTQR